jgi:hypothetical protein
LQAHFLVLLFAQSHRHIERGTGAIQSDVS